MAAIIYFGEMLIAPMLAIVLLAISPLKMTTALSFSSRASSGGPLPNMLFIGLYFTNSCQESTGCITPSPMS
jgi:hypothetical protein